MDSSEKWITTASITAVIVGLVAGLALGYWWGTSAVEDDGHHDDDFMEEQHEDEMMDNGDVMMEEGEKMETVETQSAVSVTNQTAGATVTLASLSLSDAAWIAVRDDLGILGAQKVPAGAHSNVEVTLLRPTVSGALYGITLYKDNGDPAFNTNSDILMTVNGADVLATFQAE